MQTLAAAAQTVAPAANKTATLSNTVGFGGKKKLGPCYFCAGDHLQANCVAYKQQQQLIQAHKEQLAAAQNGTSQN